MGKERLVVEIDKRTKDAFKKKARERGQSMVFILKGMIQAFLKGMDA